MMVGDEMSKTKAVAKVDTAGGVTGGAGDAGAPGLRQLSAKPPLWMGDLPAAAPTR